VRAVEYGVPIVRVASSGISQIMDGRGDGGARGSFPGQGEMVAMRILGARGARGPRLPMDRYVAPVCVVVTGIVVVMLLGREGRRRWGRRHE
jgi:apolipoprotein N-acyltransferase